MNNKYNSDYIHKEHPKSCAVDDFWGQVSRTVKGIPVSQDDIDKIILAIKNGLEFSSNDILLDIGCGNGALAQYLFNDCLKYHGIDFSEYMIEIAKANFENPPSHVFSVSDAVEYIISETEPQIYTKALCYGAFSYFSFENAESLLKNISTRFKNIECIYIGNLPDKERADQFYTKEINYSNLLDDRESPLGIWRNRDDIRLLAQKTGWKVEFSLMPTIYYSAHYRFDALLKRY